MCPGDKYDADMESEKRSYESSKGAMGEMLV